MMNSKAKLLTLLAFIIIVVLSVPLYMKNKLTSQIEQSQLYFDDAGVQVIDKNISGYLTSTVHMRYSIADGVKFKEYIFQTLQKIDPSLGTLFPSFDSEVNAMLHDLLDGMTFQSTNTVSNLLPNGSHGSISLIKLSDKVMENIKKDSELSSFFLPLLQNKAISFTIDLDANKRVQKMTMKDINLSKPDIFTIQVLGSVFTFDYPKEGISGTYTINQQLYDFPDSKKPLHVKIGKTLYMFDHLSQFNSNANIAINDILMQSQKYGRTSELSMGLLDLKTKVKTKNDINLDTTTSYKIKNLQFSNQRAVFTLGNIELSLEVTDLLKQDIQALSDAYRGMMFETDQFAKRIATKDFATALESMIHNGFDIKLSFGLQDAAMKKDVALKDMQGHINIKFPKNSIDLRKERFNALLSRVDAAGQVSMKKQDSEILKKFSPRFTKILDLGIDKDEKKIYNIDFESGHLYLNNTKF